MSNLKEAWLSLANPDITKRDYDAAFAAVNERVKTIWKYIISKSERSIDPSLLENPNVQSSYDCDWYIDEKVTATIDELKVTIDQHQNFSVFETSMGSAEKRDWYSAPFNQYYPYADGFPTELMWVADFQSTVDDKIAYAIKTLTDEREERLARKKVNKQARAIRDKEIRNKERQLQGSVLAKVKTEDGNYVLTEEEYEFVVSKLISR